MDVGKKDPRAMIYEHRLDFGDESSRNKEALAFSILYIFVIWSFFLFSNH